MKKIIYSLLLSLLIILSTTPVSAALESEVLMQWGTGEYKDVVVKNSLAFCSAYSSGLDIIDISDPLHPKLAANCKVQQSIDKLFISGKYAYATGVSYKLINKLQSTRQILTIIDISDIHHPEVVSSIDIPEFCVDVVVAGSYAYIGTFHTLTIIDIADPAHPEQVGFCNLKIAPMWLAVEGNFAYMANIFQGLQVVDISDPSTPVLIATNDELPRINNVAVSGNLAFVSSETDGLGIFDISNPVNPVLTGKYKTAEGGKTIAITENKNILLMDNQNTLYLFDVKSPKSPEILSTFKTAGTGTGISCQNQLAFISETCNGLEIINLNVPESPELLANYDFSGTPKALSLTEKYACIGDIDGIHILDITTSAAPREISQIQTTKRAESLCLKDNFLYFVGGNDSGLSIADLSNPEKPAIVAETDPEDKKNNAFSKIIVDGNYAYITDKNSYKLYIYDISDPGQPFLASFCDTQGNILDFTIENNTALIANSWKGFSLVDISNPLQPTLTNNNDTPIYAAEIATKGNFVYTGNDYNKITIFTITDPEKPVKISGFTCDCSRIYSLSINNELLQIGTDKGLKIYSIADRKNPQKMADLIDEYFVEASFSLKNLTGVVTGSSGKFILLDLKNDTPEDTSPPTTVDQLTASGQGFSSIRLNWEAATDNSGGVGVGGYRIFRQDYSESSTYATVDAAQNWFLDPNCEPDTIYTYRIQSFDKSDNPAPLSHRITIRSKSLSSDITPPTPPVNLRAENYPGNLKINWNLSFDDGSGVATYELYKTRTINDSPAANTHYEKLTTCFTSYTDTKVLPGAEYEYQIRAVDYAGNPSAKTTLRVVIPKNLLPVQYSYFLPHFCSSDDWKTLFSVTNTSAKDAQAQLRLFDKNGKLLADKQVSSRGAEKKLAPGTQMVKHWIFRENFPLESSWIEVNSDQQLSFAATFISDTYFEKIETSGTKSSSLLFPTFKNDSGNWTGLAFANPSDIPTQIVLKAYNRFGQLQAFSKPFTLAAKAQTAALAETFFDAALLPLEELTIRAEATGKITGLEFFSSTSSEMAGLKAVPLPDSCQENRENSYLYTISADPGKLDPKITGSIVNLNPKAATATLIWLDETCVSKKREAIAIPGNGFERFSFLQSLPDGTRPGYLKIISDQPLAISTEYTATNSPAGSAATYAFSQGLRVINFTNLSSGRDDSGSNNLAITNLSQLKQNLVTFDFFQSDGELVFKKERIIAPGTTLFTTMRDLLGINYQQLEGRYPWIRITGELPINGFYSYSAKDQNQMSTVSAE